MRWIYTACFPYDSWSSKSATRMYLPSLSSFVFFLVSTANVCDLFDISKGIMTFFLQNRLKVVDYQGKSLEKVYLCRKQYFKR